MTERLLGNRYLIKKRLGKGGCGSVYLCHDNKLHKDWAVKELEEPSDLERSMELELLKTISNNAFPRIVDIIKESGSVFLIMDYVDGITLKEKMKRQALTEKDVLPWAKDIAKGISYLHRMSVPILYMDCKPDNIMLTDEGEIRLVDLGSAYVCFRDKKQRISGTKYFAPKEQCKQETEKGMPDARTDIYAFGMTLYYLLTGGRKEQRRSGRLCIKDVNPSISWGMSHIIEKCTMEKPEQRYQSMEEVIEQLQFIRRVGRQKENKVRLLRLIGNIGKSLCAFLVLFLGYRYKKQEIGVNYVLCLVIIVIILFLLLCRTRKSTIYEMNKDIFCGRGKRFLYLVMLVAGIAGMSHMTTFAAEAKRDSMTSQMIEEDTEERLKICIFDGMGRKILIKDGASWEIEKDIFMSIPLDEVETGEGKVLVCYENGAGSVSKSYSFCIVKK